MIKSITKTADPAEKQRFIEAYSCLWNHPDNLPFLSSTCIEFSDKQIHEWLESTEENGLIKYFYHEHDHAIQGVVVAKYDILNGAEIMGLGIHPDFKGRSIGAGLLDHTIKIATELKFNAISASVFSDNMRMQRLLLGRQFRPIAIEHEKRCDGMSLVTYKKFNLSA